MLKYKAPEDMVFMEGVKFENHKKKIHIYKFGLPYYDIEDREIDTKELNKEIEKYCLMIDVIGENGKRENHKEFFVNKIGMRTKEYSDTVFEIMDYVYGISNIEKELYLEVEKYLRLEKDYVFKEIFPIVQIEDFQGASFLKNRYTRLPGNKIFPIQKDEYLKYCDITEEKLEDKNGEEYKKYTFDFKNGLEFMPFSFKMIISGKYSLDIAKNPYFKIAIDLLNGKNPILFPGESELLFIPDDLKKEMSEYIEKKK